MGLNSFKLKYKRQSKRKQNRGKRTKSWIRQRGGTGGGSDTGDIKPSYCQLNGHQWKDIYYDEKGKANRNCKNCGVYQRVYESDRK